MSCIHIKKDGEKCGKGILFGSKYCHINSHYTTIDEYKCITETIINSFNNERVSMDNYNIFDVDPDGACCYRAIAQALFNNLETIRNKDILKDFFKRINLNIDKLKNDDTVSKKPLSYTHETLFAQCIQDIARIWLVENSHMNFPPTGESIEDLVLLSHKLPSLKVYNTLFSKFAGEDDFILEDESNFAELSLCSIDNINKKQKSKIAIPERWGGMAEQFALSSYFGIPIRVYTLERIDKRNFTIHQTTTRSKIAKLRLLQELIPYDTLCESGIDLLTVQLKGMDHYQVMFKKN